MGRPTVIRRDPHERAATAYFDHCAANGVLAEFEADELDRLEAVFDRWGLTKGERVLEVGCGSCRLSSRIVTRIAPHGELISFDISLGMVAAARHRGLPPAVQLLRTSASRLPFADGVFDRALCFCVLPHLHDPRAALAELRRTLRPGAGLWIDHLTGRESLNAFHRSLGGEVAAHVIPPDAVVRDLLEGAGFDVLELGDAATGHRATAIRREG